MLESESTLSVPFLTLPINTNNDENHRNSPFGYDGEFRDALSTEVTTTTSPALLSSSSSTSLLSVYPTENTQLATKNIRRTLALTFFTFTSRSVWSQSLLSIYVILVWKDHPEYVGYVLATMGIIQMFSSALIRCATRHFDISSSPSKNNKCRFFLILLFTSLIGLSAMGISLYAITFQQSTFYIFLLANGLWGMSWGVLESILPNVFAESASLVAFNNKLAERTYKMSSNLVRLGIIVGSLLTMAIFKRLGNKWNIKNCALVMLVGLGCNLPVVFLLCSLKLIPFDNVQQDEEREEDEDEQLYYDEYNVGYEPSILPSYEEALDENYILEESEDSLEDRSFIPEEDNEDVDNNFCVSLREGEPSPVDEERKEYIENNCCRSLCCSNKMRVLILINLADILSSFAGGMSIFYLPVFLVRRLNLDPISIQFLYLIIPLGQWLSPVIAKVLAKLIGPCRACILMQGTYVLFMLSMIVCHLKGYPIWIICALFVFHGSLMNSTSTLSRIMISQYVPVEDQHKWGGVAESIQMLLWSCAGVTGGMIVGKWGLLVVFFVTVTLQFLATLPLAILYCLLDPHLDDAGKYSTSSIVVGDDDTSSDGDNDAYTPPRSRYKQKEKRSPAELLSGSSSTLMMGAFLSPETQATYIS